MCYYVLSGLLDSGFVHEDGSNAELVMRGQGTIFPLYYTYKEITMEQVLEVRAIERCELIVIPKDELCELMLEKPALALAMIDAYGKFSCYLDYLVANRSYGTVRAKVCGFLLLHSDEYGFVELSHEQIARAIGASRPKVSEALSDLKAEGVIRTHRELLKIEDFEGLRRKSSYMARIDSER